MSTKTLEKSKNKGDVEKRDPEGFFPLGLTSLNDLDRIFDEYFNRNWFSSLRPRLSKFEDLWGTYEMRPPSMDVIDRENEIVVKAELPGVDKKDLDVTVSDNILTIKGNSKQETKSERDEFYSREIRTGSFSRSIGLPGNVDTSKIKANFNNGLLELSLPKTAKSIKKTIKVS